MDPSKAAAAEPGGPPNGISMIRFVSPVKPNWFST